MWVWWETWTQEFLPWILQVRGLPPSPLQVSTPCTLSFFAWSILCRSKWLGLGFWEVSSRLDHQGEGKMLKRKINFWWWWLCQRLYLDTYQCHIISDLPLCRQHRWRICPARRIFQVGFHAVFSDQRKGFQYYHGTNMSSHPRFVQSSGLPGTHFVQQQGRPPLSRLRRTWVRGCQTLQPSKYQKQIPNTKCK